MTTTLQIRIDKKTKNKAQKTFRAMGLDMSSGVKLYLAQVVKEQTIPFPITSVNNWPAKKKQQLIKGAKEALRSGQVFRTAKELHDDILGNG